MSKNLEYRERERQRKRENRRQASEAQREKERRTARARDKKCFPFNPKFRKIRLEHQMERTISVWSNWNVEGGPLRPKCPFPFDKIAVPRQTVAVVIRAFYEYSRNERRVLWKLARETHALED